MKTFYPLLILFISLSVSAQVPQQMNYQAVVRDSSGNEIANTNVRLRFSIIDSSSGGTIAYSENVQITTNSLGLVNHRIGTGTPITGNFAAINWGTGNKHLKVDLDMSGGTNYTTMGVSALVSVPYALYAANGPQALQDLQDLPVPMEQQGLREHRGQQDREVELQVLQARQGLPDQPDPVLALPDQQDLLDLQEQV